MSNIDTETFKTYIINQAKLSLRLGEEYPYDGGKDFWKNGSTSREPPALDWAHAAARGVMSNLKSKSDLKDQLELMSHNNRIELVEILAEIIRQAYLKSTLVNINTVLKDNKLIKTVMVPTTWLSAKSSSEPWNSYEIVPPTDPNARAVIFIDIVNELINR